MKKSQLITFPDTALPLDARVDIQAARPLGLTAKVFIHEIARQLPFYNQSIKCRIKGEDKKGEKIAINTVGRWLFGAPGYAGRVRVALSGDKVLLYYPQGSPKVVHELIASLKEAMETKQ
jgi:hypothetical protein